NVAILLSRGLDRVLGDLAALGFDAEWHCIPASAIGAPHRRDRIWIVAYPGRQRGAGWREPGNVAGAAGACETHSKQRQWHGDAPHDSGKALANAKGERRGEARRLRRDEPAQWVASGSQDVSYADRPRLSLPWAESLGENGKQIWRLPSTGDWWAIEPDVGRVAHGIPGRVDRLRQLGNSVVPQIPEIIGRAIM